MGQLPAELDKFGLVRLLSLLALVKATGELCTKTSKTIAARKRANLSGEEEKSEQGGGRMKARIQLDANKRHECAAFQSASRLFHVQLMAKTSR